MRGVKPALLAALVASAPCETAAAYAPAVIVHDDFGSENTDVTFARLRLQAIFRGFRQEVAHTAGRDPPFGELSFSRQTNLELTWGTNWPAARVAALAGMVRSSDQLLHPLAEIRIGTDEAPYLFHDVEAQIPTGGDTDEDVGLYIIIIGYALMVRYWQRVETRWAVVPIATVLQTRLDGAGGEGSGINRTSLCRRELRRVIATIRAKANEGPISPAIPPPDIDCGIRH
jgi:hypothetical protein